MKKYTFFALMVVLIGCSTGVKHLIRDPSFQDQNRPLREVRLLVFNNSPEKNESITQFLKECSDLIEDQVGIRLKILALSPIQWSGMTPRGILTDMHRATDAAVYDISVAFTARLLPVDGLVLVGLGTFVGVIDDTYRKHIVVRLMDKYIFLHEFFHAFIFNQTHSQVCVMASGFYPLGRGCLWLSEEDREEVLKNKWRAFNEKPRLEGGYDFIAER